MYRKKIQKNLLIGLNALCIIFSLCSCNSLVNKSHRAFSERYSQTHGFNPDDWQCFNFTYVETDDLIVNGRIEKQTDTNIRGYFETSNDKGYYGIVVDDEQGYIYFSEIDMESYLPYKKDNSLIKIFDNYFTELPLLAESHLEFLNTMDWSELKGVVDVVTLLSIVDQVVNGVLVTTNMWDWYSIKRKCIYSDASISYSVSKENYITGYTDDYISISSQVTNYSGSSWKWPSWYNPNDFTDLWSV